MCNAVVLMGPWPPGLASFYKDSQPGSSQMVASYNYGPSYFALFLVLFMHVPRLGSPPPAAPQIYIYIS
jgi:hypothetical protein